MSGTKEDGTPINCACDGESVTCVYHQDRPYLIGVKPMLLIYTEVRGENVCVIRDGEVFASYNRLSNDGAHTAVKGNAYNLRKAEKEHFVLQVKSNKEKLAKEVVSNG